VLDNLVSSAVPLVRAFATQAAWSRVERGVLSIEDALKVVAHLEAHERLHAMGEWVGALRVKANREGRRDSEPRAAMRRAIFEAMQAAWPRVPPNTDFLRKIAARVGGPIEGSWAVSTTTELLLPLVQDGRLTWRSLVDLWSAVLGERWSGEGAHFYADTDANLSEAYALVVASSPSGDSDREIAALSSIAAKDRRILGTPFLRSKDYSLWAQAVQRTLWVRGLTSLIRRNATAWRDPERIQRVMTLHGELVNALPEQAYAGTHVGDGPLGAWLRHVEDEGLTPEELH
jgi:hypothetical protein